MTVFLAFLLGLTIKFEGSQANKLKAVSNGEGTPPTNAFNPVELCRPIDGTPFHAQCLRSEVVKQKGVIPRHLRPPWLLNSTLFGDNELGEEKAKSDGCYACYKGTKASNGMAPGQEYCACTYKGQAPNKKFGKIFGTFNRSRPICLHDFRRMALMPSCGNKYYDHVKHCAMVHFYDNDAEKEPMEPEKTKRILVLLDGCITGSSTNGTANVKIEYRERWNGIIGNCKGERKTVFESTIELRESLVDKNDTDSEPANGSSSFTFPMEFTNRICWNLVTSHTPLSFDGITITLSGDFGTKQFQLLWLSGHEKDNNNSRVQEMRGLQLDLRSGKAAQWRDPFGGYEFTKQKVLKWQPTDLKYMNEYGMPDEAMMYTSF